MGYFDNLKDKTEVVFLSMMELGWEVQRWSGAINQFIKKHPDKRCIVATFVDRVDLYSNCEIYPIYVDGLYTRKRPDMYKVHHLDKGEEEGIIANLQENYPKAYLCRPPTSKYGRWLFQPEEQDFEFLPRSNNKKVINNLLNDKKSITISSRHRIDCTQRNWYDFHWYTLFDMVKDFNVFVTGTFGGYIRPTSKMPHCHCLEDYNTEGTSTIGLTIEAIKASRVTVGQQSGVPVLSLQLGTPVISWGHEKHRHTVEENPKGTTCYFFEDPSYSISPEIIYKQILEMIK